MARFVATAVLVMAAVVLSNATVAFADETTEEMLSIPGMMTTIKSLGSLVCTGNPLVASADAAVHNKGETKKNYWAFMSDAHLTEDQLAKESQKFDAIWDSLMRVGKEYEVTKVGFIGFNTLGMPTCADLYYLAVMPRGPVLVRFTMEFKVADRVRMFDIRTFTNWDEIREHTRAIQHAVNPSRVPTITVEPKNKTETKEESGESKGI
jgi:hypothetical protein